MRITLTQDQMDQVNEVMEMNSVDEYEIRVDYSGRWMFNKTCIGFVTKHIGDMIQFTKAVAAAVTNDEDDADNFAEDMQNSTRLDSMGLSIIYYWPGLSVEEKQ